MKNDSFTSHILELRKRISWCFGCYLLIVCPLIIWAKPGFALFCKTLVLLPNTQLIATQVATPFMVPIKLALYLAFYLSAPMFAYQVWSFIAPALYPNEKKPVRVLSSLSMLLFYIGALFAFFVVCPIALQFFAHMAPANVQVMTDLNHYISFILNMMAMFGLAFQVPIAVAFLLWTGVQTKQSLQTKRPYVVVGAFVIGMLLTPPDVISQILMAVPMIGLFEMGLLLGQWLSKPQAITHGSAP